MALEGSIISGGLEYPALWVHCRAAASFKPRETLVHIQAADVADPLPFFVDSDLVTPPDPPPGEEVDGRVKVILLDRDSGRLVIEVPGEAISHGPKILIAEGLVAHD